MSLSLSNLPLLFVSHCHFHFLVFPFLQVEVVLHCAATVRFDENLSAAISMNVSDLKIFLVKSKDENILIC